MYTSVVIPASYLRVDRHRIKLCGTMYKITEVAELGSCVDITASPVDKNHSTSEVEITFKVNTLVKAYFKEEYVVGR